jgi:transcriptional regulator
MYVPASFRETRLEVLHALIREHSFGTLISMMDGELYATHLPFLLDAERGPNGTLIGHMARANPHWQRFLGASPGLSPGAGDTLAIFQGPHAYISPSWYVSEQAVPTWNYAVVHAYGTPTIVDDPARVRAILDATVHEFEQGQSRPWSTARLGEDYVNSMARGVAAFEIPIARLEGKRKLGQNRPSADVASAAAALQSTRDPMAVAVADLMLEAAHERPQSTEATEA